MSTTPGPSSRSAIGNTPRVYPPDLQPLLQSILAALADIDFVHAERGRAHQEQRRGRVAQAERDPQAG